MNRATVAGRGTCQDGRVLKQCKQESLQDKNNTKTQHLRCEALNIQRHLYVPRRLNTW